MSLSDELFARLQKGESADKIAAELAEALNQAEDKHAAEVEAQAKATKSKEDRIFGLVPALTALFDWVHEAYPDHIGEADKATDDDILDMATEIVEMIDPIVNLISGLKVEETPNGVKVSGHWESDSKSKETKKNGGDPFMEFFKMMGL